MAQLGQKDFSGGMIDINVNLAPSNTVSLMLNMDADTEVGSAVSRLGRETIGAQITAASTILGLGQHIDTATPANNKLFATLNAPGAATSVIYDVIGAANSVTGLTASAKMRFLTFLGATLALNGADGERSYTVAGWITTGGAFDLANIPSSNKVNLATVFLDRVYLAGDTAQPTRLYYSGVSNGSAVSWTVGNGYVDIDAQSNAGPITALGRVPGYILIFKERAMTRWNYSSAFPEELMQIGTPSQESVVMGGGLCAFYSNSNENAKGFYITDGGRPVCISQNNNRPIKKWIDAIASANESSIAGRMTDRGFSWSVGDITVDGETYSNCEFRYNRIMNQWTMRTYPTKHVIFANYLVSSVNTTVAGDNAGTVYRIDKPGVYVDSKAATTQGFPWKVRQNHLTHGEMKQKNVLERAVVRGKNIDSARVVMYLDEDLTTPADLSGQTFVQKVLSIFKTSERMVGNTISIEVAGESAGAYSYVREIELPSVTIDDYGN